MFGVEYLENPWREKFEIFWGASRVSIFSYAKKWGSWLESFRSEKVCRDPNRACTEEELMKILLSQYLQLLIAANFWLSKAGGNILLLIAGDVWLLIAANVWLLIAGNVWLLIAGDVWLLIAGDVWLLIAGVMFGCW